MHRRLIQLAHLSRVARDMPWPLVISRGLRKLGYQSLWMRRTDFLCSPDTRRPTKSVEIVLNSLRQASISPSALAAAIPDSLVMEIGCGRHIGFASFSLGLGANGYIGVDPALDADLLLDADVQRGYLSPALSAAKNLAAELAEFRDLPFVLDENQVDELMSRCRLTQGGIGDLAGCLNKADICVSISCLEHIRDFAEAARVMATVSHSQTIHVHVVNFSSHLSKQRPFDQLYEMPYAEFGKRWQYGINGLRLSDMLKMLERAGLPLRAVPLDVRPDALPGSIDPEWASRYSRDELALRTAVLTSL